MIWDIIFLAIGIFLVIKGADLFVDSGSEIGKVFRISEMLLGLTLVAFGTSLPELIISLNAAQNESNGITLGNILGSNMFNVCMILGIVAIIKPISFSKNTVRKDMYMNFLSAAVLFIMVIDVALNNGNTNMISRSEGIILIILFMVFMYYNLYDFEGYFKNRKKSEETEFRLKLKDMDKLGKNILLMILGIAMLFFGGDMVVDSVTDASSRLNISETFIAILIVSVGTSLPEIVTSITAIKKGKQDIAVGNIIGSNIFNILLVLGLSSIIFPMALPNQTLIVDTFMVLATSCILILFAKNHGKYEVGRLEGALLVALYALYTVFVIFRK